jgi:hypothetical protein
MAVMDSDQLYGKIAMLMAMLEVRTGSCQFLYLELSKSIPKGEKCQSLSIIVSGVESIYRSCIVDSEAVCKPVPLVRIIFCK